MRPPSSTFFFFNDTATTEIYTLSLHDALPISEGRDQDDDDAVDDQVDAAARERPCPERRGHDLRNRDQDESPDRKSTRLNSSHLVISYAVFCLKEKNTIKYARRRSYAGVRQPH